MADFNGELLKGSNGEVFSEHDSGVIVAFADYVDTFFAEKIDESAEPVSFAQPEGYALANEAVRDAVIDRISKKLDFSLEDHLNKSDDMRRDRKQTGLLASPWMLNRLGLTVPSEGAVWVPGDKREATLAETDTTIYGFRELLIENYVTDAAGKRLRRGRLMYYVQRPQY